MKKLKYFGATLAIVLLVVVIVVVVIKMHGEVKTSGSTPADVTAQSLLCESNIVKYPIFTYGNANSRNTKINASFYDNKLNSISLTYTLYYDNADRIKASDANNHAAMNISFGSDGLDADAFNAHYSRMSDSLQMGIYASSTEFNSVAAKYFLIEQKEDKNLPQTLTDFQKAYAEKGFNCKVNN